MIVLYHLIPGPSGDCGVYGYVAVDEHPGRYRWWTTFDAAELESRELCRKIGERPRPGFQHTRPVPVIVVEESYMGVLDVARGDKVSQREVHRRWALADGSFTDEDPAGACPECPPGSPRDSCKTCFGTGLVCEKDLEA